ncbi:MAG: PTS sugar transporter subunit IIC [Anaerorhabdus sp.]
MGKSTEKWTDKLNEVIGRLNSSKIIKALMGGMMVSMPAIMSGSVATILKAINIGGYQAFITSTGILTVLDSIVLITINFTALYTVFGIAYSYAKQNEQDPVPAGILGITSFLLVTPFEATEVVPGYMTYSLPTGWLGAQGVFSAMIIGFVVGGIYSFVKKNKWTIKLPDTVPPVISSSFEAIIPGIIVVVFFAIVTFIFNHTAWGSMHSAIYSLLQSPIQSIGGNIWSLLIVIFIGQVLWVFGIHGPMVVMSLAMVAWRPLDLANVTAFNAGQALPNTIGYAFYQLTTFAGGGIGLAICMLFAKSKRYKTLGKLAVVPAAFGITEPLIFGAPIVMNFKLAIPHVVLPMLSAIIGYVLTMAGILPNMMGVGLPTGTPIVLFGFLQGGWIAALFQVALIGLWVVGFWPFLRSLDKEEYEKEIAEESAK